MTRIKISRLSRNTSQCLQYKELVIPACLQESTIQGTHDSAWSLYQYPHKWENRYPHKGPLSKALSKVKPNLSKGPFILHGSKNCTPSPNARESLSCQARSMQQGSDTSQGIFVKLGRCKEHATRLQHITRSLCHTRKVQGVCNKVHQQIKTWRPPSAPAA